MASIRTNASYECVGSVYVFQLKRNKFHVRRDIYLFLLRICEVVTERGRPHSKIPIDAIVLVRAKVGFLFSAMS